MGTFSNYFNFRIITEADDSLPQKTFAIHFGKEEGSLQKSVFSLAVAGLRNLLLVWDLELY